MDLERALEEEKQRNHVRINHKRHEIDYLQSQRWSIRLYWINPVAWKHDRKIGWAVAELKQLQALDFILPTGVSVRQMETQLSEAKSLLERMTHHVASIEHQQREAAEQHDEQTKKSQNFESFQRCWQSFTRWAIPLVLVFTATPFLWALSMYYVIAPLSRRIVRRHRFDELPSIPLHGCCEYESDIVVHFARFEFASRLTRLSGIEAQR